MTDREHYDMLMDVLFPLAVMTQHDLTVMLRAIAASFLLSSVVAIGAFVILVRSHV